MAKWEELPITDRAQYMRVAVQNGYRDIRSIREAYNKYAEGGVKDNYNTWLENEARINSRIWGMSYEDVLQQMKNDRSYDYRKFYEAQLADPNNPEYQRDLEGNSHYNDFGKSVYHPTASTGSYYSSRKDPKYNPMGIKFGEWLNNGHEYRMSDDMIRAGSSPYDTFDYLSKAEDGGVKLRDERGRMFRDFREPTETYIGGVLPTVTINGNNKFEDGGIYNAGILPEVQVTDYRPIHLETYYPVLSPEYRYTGHSALEVPLYPSNKYLDYQPFTWNGREEYKRGIVDKTMESDTYNLITNNCADATLGALNYMFKTNESPMLFTTPGDVYDYAVNKLKGKLVEDKNGRRVISIPRNKDNYKELSDRFLDWHKKQKDNETSFIELVSTMYDKNGGYDPLHSNGGRLLTKSNSHAYGGSKGNIYAGNGDSPNILDDAWNAIGEGFTWLDNAVDDYVEPWVAGAQLATGAATLVAPESVVAPVAYVGSNILGGVVDGYQALRSGYKAITDDNVEHFWQSPHLIDAGKNLGELGLDVFGAKAVSNLNKAKNAEVATRKALTGMERKSLSTTKRVGTGAGRSAARRAAKSKAIYNAGRNQALQASEEALAKRGVTPALGEYYQRKLIDEMAKRGYGVSFTEALKSAERTAWQNNAFLYGVSAPINANNIYQKIK